MKKYLRKDFLPKTSRFKVSIDKFSGFDAKSDDSKVSLNYAKFAYNVGIRNGALVNATGISDFKFINNGGYYGEPEYDKFPIGHLKNAYCYRFYDADTNAKQHHLIFTVESSSYVFAVDMDRNVYHRVNQNKMESNDIVFTTYFWNNKNVLMYFDRVGQKMYVYDTFSTKIFDCPKVTSACEYFSRLYVTTENSNRLQFSQINDPSNWTIAEGQGGYIDFIDNGGKLLKLLRIKDYLFIFRENSIYKMTGFSETEDFKVERIWFSEQEIMPKTIELCHDKIIFFTTKEMFVLDGFNVFNIHENVTPLIDNLMHANCAYNNGKYYLTCYLKNPENIEVGDEIIGYTIKNNGVLTFDINTGEVSIFRGTSVKQMAVINCPNFDGIICMYYNFRALYFGMLIEDGQIYETMLRKIWRSPMTNFDDYQNYKVIKKVYIITHHDIELTFTNSDGKNISVYFNGSEKVQSARIGLPCEAVKLTIVSNSVNLYVPKLEFDVDISRRYYARRAID